MSRPDQMVAPMYSDMSRTIASRQSDLIAFTIARKKSKSHKVLRNLELTDFDFPRFLTTQVRKAVFPMSAETLWYPPLEETDPDGGQPGGLSK